MKGISAMIATVLVVAFTVAVGAILATWFTSITRTTTAGTETQSQAIIKCANSGFDIISVTSSSVTVTMSSSDVKIYTKFIRASDGTVITATDTLTSAGEAKSLSWTRGTNTSVTVSALCEYGTFNTTIEASCQVGESCWV